jgi:hypothetical protein
VLEETCDPTLVRLCGIHVPGIGAPQPPTDPSRE